jgi:glycerophosphoryl diester phosphodiesterase
MHDERVDRTTDGQGAVAEKTLSELKALDAGSWFSDAFSGERVPTLEEALEVCAGRARLFVELKRGGGPALVEAALARIARSTCEVAVISFGPEEVQGVARARPDLALGFLVGRQTVAEHGVDRLVEAARQLGATFFSPQDSAVDAALVATAHEAGLPVSVWTVDEPQRMRALADLGVAAITTNVPDVALAVFS